MYILKNIGVSLVFLFCVGTSYGQITLNKETHFPDLGDEWVIQQMDTAVAIPSGGAVVTWDYSGLTPLGDSTKIVNKKPEATDYGSRFPKADIAQVTKSYDSTGNVSSRPSIGYYTLYNNNSINLGLVTPSSGRVVNYDNGQISFTYPFTNLDTVKDNFSGTYYDPNTSDSIYREGYSEVKAIGYGTLQTPFDTFNNVLLTKRHTVVIDSYYSSNTTSKFETRNWQWYVDYNEQWVLDISKAYYSFDTSKSVSYVDPGPAPQQNIYGIVKDPSLNYVTEGKVVAYGISNNEKKHSIVDVHVLNGSGNYGVKVYKNQDILIQAIPDNQTYPNLLSTYYNKADRWENAQKIQFMNDTSGFDLITRHYSPVTGGSGTVKGKVVEGSNYDGLNKRNQKKTQGDPLANVNCSIVETGRDSIYQYTTTDSLGRFQFDSLPTGDYNVRTDIPGIPVDTTGQNNFEVTSDGGTHSVELVVDSDKVTVKSQVGIEETTSHSQKLKVKGFYPNPGKATNLYLQHQGSGTKEYRIEVIDMTGRVIERMKVPVDQSTRRIPLRLSNEKEGMYFVKIISPRGNATIRKWMKFKR